VKAKFEQNPKLKTKLLAYKGKEFRECTMCPNWGAGIYLENTRSGDKIGAGYRNKMGNILMKVRDELKAK